MTSDTAGVLFPFLLNLHGDDVLRHGMKMSGRVLPSMATLGFFTFMSQVSSSVKMFCGQFGPHKRALSQPTPSCLRKMINFITLRQCFHHSS